MKIYTKTGDTGETSLFGGLRVFKSHVLIDFYGSVDELNSWVGRIEAEIHLTEKKEMLQKIQSDLFKIGGTFAGWKSNVSSLSTRVTEMEVEIDAMETELPKLANFILPGGTKEAASVHIVRSITRKVERQLVRLIQEHKELHLTKDEQKVVLQYFNRLSDFFFVFARFINMRAGVQDIPWVGIERVK